jgi:hypothetical protein
MGSEKGISQVVTSSGRIRVGFQITSQWCLNLMKLAIPDVTFKMLELL